VLPCVDVFVADRFFIWAPILRTCLALRLGARLANAPFVALRHPNLVRPYYKVYLQAKICSYPPSSSSFSLVLPCVDVFIADAFFVWAPILRTRLVLRLGAQLADVPCVALGHPTCRRVDVPCVCVADVRWGAQLADVPCVALGRPTCERALRLHCKRALGRPACGRALRCVALQTYVGARNLRIGLVLRLGAHLADVPCIALGRPTLVRPY
jgi:hypothetical protein